MEAISPPDGRVTHFDFSKMQPSIWERMFSWQGLFCFAALWPSSKALSYIVNMESMPNRIRMYSFLIVCTTQLLSLATFVRTDEKDEEEIQRFQEICTIALSYFFVWLLIHSSILALIPQLHFISWSSSAIYTVFFGVHTFIFFRIVNDANKNAVDYHPAVLILLHVFLFGLCAVIFHFHRKNRVGEAYDTEEEAYYDILARRCSFLMMVYYGVFSACTLTFVGIHWAIGENSLFLETVMYVLLIVGAPSTLCAILRPDRDDEEDLPIREDMEEYEAM